MEQKQKNYLEDLFSSEVLKWRYGKSLLVSLLFQVVISSVLSSLFSVIFIDHILNPFQLLSLAFYWILHPLWLWNLPYQALCIILLTRIHVHSYSTHSWVPERRIQYVTATLKPKKILSSAMMICISCLLIHQYAYQVHPHFSYLTTNCSERSDDICVNHEAVLIIFAGFLFGLKLTYKYYVANYRVVKFLPCQPNHLTLLKNKLQLRRFLEACSLYDVGICFVLGTLCTYLLLAASNVISTLLIISVKQEFHFFELLSHVFGLKLILTLIFCLSLLSFNIHCFFLTFNQFLTQSLELPICTEDSAMIAAETQTKNVWKLSNALVSSSTLLQLMGFKHFKDFSEDSSSWGVHYRAQIFTISQPGGHPHNWLSILNPSLNLIRKFTEKLRLNNCMDEQAPFAKATTTDINKNQVSKPSFSPAAKMKTFLQGLKQYPLFCYLLSELPDAKNRRIFSEAQSVIWAVQGLSNVVAASFHDDHYGVVQRNIADILTCLTQLQQVVDKVGRGFPVRKCGPNNNLGRKCHTMPHDAQLRKSLRIVLRSSLYTITNTFKDSIRDVVLNDDVRTKLSSYLSFQEG